MTGRPSDYTEEIADQICERLMDAESLRSICEDERMPSRTTVHRWMVEIEGFGAKCARAREIQADTLFDDIQEVADSGNPDDVQRAKLRVATMQWRASKLAPKKYGDRLDHTSSDGSMTPKPGLDVSRLSASALEEIVAAGETGETDAG